jgi:hypothetical protein
MFNMRIGTRGLAEAPDARAKHWGRAVKSTDAIRQITLML